MNSDQQPYQDSGETVRMPAGDPIPDSGQLAPGVRVFGRYRLHSIAGKGGMGVVWRAQDEDLKETVALKFLPDAVSSDPVAIEELKGETSRARKLRHTNIVAVYDIVREVTHTAVTMEFVDGQTMSHLRLEQPDKVFAVETLAPFVTQLCAALDYAHQEAKVVHRDLKPANLMVTREGVLKVTDFGIARSIADTATRATGRAADSSGTLPYMSPQQVNGRKPTAADDVYALGATLYELLTGKPPFHRGDPYSLMNQIANVEPLRLSEMRAELEFEGPPIPAVWEDTIAACLAKNPEDRPQSAGRVVRLLKLSTAPGAKETATPFTPAKPARKQPAAGGSPRAATAAAGKPGRSFAWLKWLVGAAVIGGLAAWLLGYLPIPRPWIPAQARQEQVDYAAILNQIQSLGDSSSLDDINRIEAAVKSYLERAPAIYRPEAAGEWEKRKKAWFEAKAITDLKDKKARELADFTGIKGRIESVADTTVTADFNAVGKAVQDYLATAPQEPSTLVPEGYKAHVEAAWKTRQTKWEAAQQRISRERREAQEKANLAAIHERIAGLADGAPREEFDAVEFAVKSFLALAPENHRKEVSAVWANRKASWEAAADAARKQAEEARKKEAERIKAELEKHDYEAIMDSIKAVTESTPNDKVLAAGQDVQKYLAAAPARYKAEVNDAWKKRQAALEEARLRAEREREQKAYDAVMARIKAAADGCAREQLSDSGFAVRNYLSTAPARFKTDVAAAWEKRQADWEKARLAAYRGEFVVNTVPDGAEVRVDDQVVPNRTPLTVNNQKLGRHQVQVQLTGYDEWSGEVTVTEGSIAPLDVRLVRSLGKVTIIGTPGAEVYEGAHRRGTLPLTLDKVPTGPVRYRVQARGYQTIEYSGEVVRNRELRLDATLPLQTLEVGQAWILLDLDLEMRPVTPGSFSMGSTTGDGDEQPVTRVTLTRPYWLGKTEVTQAQWQTIMGGNPSENKGNDLPVEKVSWEEAIEFCRKLTARERASGRLPAGYAFTLPTEAQWEYACRAGTTGDFAGNLDAMAWYAPPNANIVNVRTHPVGRNQPNAWGFYDMHGNVSEWCLDWYGKYPGGSVSDPAGPKDSSWKGHIRRGGAFGDGEKFLTSSRRSAYKLRAYSLGLRLALVPAP